MKRKRAEEKRRPARKPGAGRKATEKRTASPPREVRHGEAIVPPGQSPGPATVWRDEHGVPHIEADSETAAWYAMGYEEARDGLYPVQAMVKRIRGQAAEFLGDGFSKEGLLGEVSNVFNDLVVQLYVKGPGAKSPEDPGHAEPLDEESLMGLLTLWPPDDESEYGVHQLYENLKAYTDGLNAYRKEVETGTASTEIRRVHSWLQREHLEWVYEDPIDVVDVLSWGRWFKALGSLTVASIVDPNPVKRATTIDTEGLDGPGPFDPVESIAAHREGRPAVGSNGIGWTFEYMEHEGTRYAGCVGDPHGGAQPWLIRPKGPGGTHPMDPAWFCHVRVLRDDGSARIDSFGYLLHGSGVMLTSHNWDVAFGGSAASPNIADSFLLRVEVDEDGVPTHYYSYYDDAFVEFGEIPVGIKRGHDDDGLLPWSTGAKPLLDAGVFGFVYNTEPFEIDYGVDDDWDAEGALPFTPDGKEGTKVVVAYRSPMDTALDYARHHSRFAVFFYEMMKARSVHDVKRMVETHDPGHVVEICAVDRRGSLFASFLGTIPQRGDDAKLVEGHPKALKIDVAERKYLVYEKFSSQAKPVPACFADDKDFDWQFVDGVGPDVEIRFLTPKKNGEELGPEYLPYVLFDRDDPASNNPPTSMVHGENPGFATMSNDHVWHAFKKGVKSSDKKWPFGNHEMSERWSDNALFNQMREAGTTYFSLTASPKALQKNQQMIDWFSAIGTDGGSTPPMDLETAKRFVVSNELYVARDYVGRDEDREVPVSIRVLRELVDNIDDLCEDAAREVRFFRDLWETLHDESDENGWTSFEDSMTSTVVDLKKLWVDNVQVAHPDMGTGLPWYAPACATFEGLMLPMPTDSPLIDFLWSETSIGGGAMDAEGRWAGVRLGDLEIGEHDGAPPPIFDDAERAKLRELVRELVDWDADVEKYAMDRRSRSAALFAQYELGFEASRYDFTRRWLPLLSLEIEGVNTSVAAVGSATLGEILDEGVDEGWLFPDAYVALEEGALPPDLQMDGFGQFEASVLEAGGGLDDEPRFVALGYSSMASLRDVAFPKDTHSSAYGTKGVVDAIKGFPEPPFNSLYETAEDGTLQIRDQPTPKGVSAITEFFLGLGGWLDWLWVNDVNMEKMQVPISTKFVVPDGEEGGLPEVLAHYSPRYPLTRNLARVALLQRLLDTRTFLEQHVTKSGRPRLRRIFRARAHDYQGTLRWPTKSVASVQGAPGPPKLKEPGGDRHVEPQEVPDPKGKGCDGGSLRVTSVEPDIAPGELVSEKRAQGFQKRVWCAGGSSRPLVVFFPEDQPEAPPLSYYWNIPGQRVIAFESDHYADHMRAYAQNELLESHYATDFEANPDALSRSEEFNGEIDNPKGYGSL